jgi:hypothetical protein
VEKEIQVPLEELEKVEAELLQLALFLDLEQVTEEQVLQLQLQVLQ